MPPLGEHKWLDLVHGGRAGFAGFVAREPGHDRVVGYAQLSRGTGQLGGRVRRAPADAPPRGPGRARPAPRRPRPRSPRRAAATSTSGCRSRPRCTTRSPARSASPRPRAAADAAVPPPRARARRPGDAARAPFGWARTRQRGSSSTTAPSTGTPNRAPGSWPRFVEREQQPWFDPAASSCTSGRAGSAAFCWTKIHDDEPPLGEIYVIGVDPDIQGHGLGRQLVVAGCALSARGVPTGCSTSTPTTSRPSSSTRALGFAVDHRDRAYVGDVAASPGADEPLRPRSAPSSRGAARPTCPGYRAASSATASTATRRPEELTELPRSLRRAPGGRCPSSRPPSAGARGASPTTGATLKWLFAPARRRARSRRSSCTTPRQSTVCVSSQAGCAMACTFCATGEAGFGRQLSTGEIVEQVVLAARAARRARPARSTNVVFMGMGEPLANFDARLAPRSSGSSTTSASPPVTSPSRPSASCRASGAWPARRLQVNLAVSLHAANDALRDELVPLNRRYPLDVLLEACQRLHRRDAPAASRFEWALHRRGERPTDATPPSSPPSPAPLRRPRQPHPAQPDARATRSSARRPPGSAAFRDELRRRG